MSNARLLHSQQVHYLRKSVIFSDVGTVLKVGEIPAGSIILQAASGAAVTTVFNAATTNTIDIGTTADPNLFGTALASGTAGFVPLDEAIGGYLLADDTVINATVQATGAAATAGAAEIVICYIPDNDG